MHLRRTTIIVMSKNDFVKNIPWSLVMTGYTSEKKNQTTCLRHLHIHLKDPCIRIYIVITWLYAYIVNLEYTL